MEKGERLQAEVAKAVEIVSDLLAAMKGAPTKKGINAYDQAEEFIAEHTGLELPPLTTLRQQVEQLQAELDEALKLLEENCKYDVCTSGYYNWQSKREAFLAKHEKSDKAQDKKPVSSKQCAYEMALRNIAKEPGLAANAQKYAQHVIMLEGRCAGDEPCACGCGMTDEEIKRRALGRAAHADEMSEGELARWVDHEERLQKLERQG